MNGKEELKQEIEQELQWIQYRQKMLDIMEEKLLQMKELTLKAKGDNLSNRELEDLNTRLNNLSDQVKAMDSESRKKEHRKILE